MDSKNQLIDEALQRIREILPESFHKNSEDLFRQFYANLELADLKSFTPRRLSQTFLELWNLLQERSPYQSKYRLYRWKPKDNEEEAERLVIDLINPDRPFVVDSFIALLQRHGLKASLLSHPVICTRRDKNNMLTHILPPLRSASSGDQYESIIHCEIKDILNRTQVEALETELPLVLRDVALATQDWKAMRNQALSILHSLSLMKETSKRALLEETMRFMGWVENGHFTFLGYCEYTLSQGIAGACIETSRLGIMKNGDFPDLVSIFQGMDPKSPEAQAYITDPRIIFINKSSGFSTVHRATQMDVIGIRMLDDAQKVVGIKVFVGLFTSEAYDSSARDIPLLCQKVDQIVQRAGLDKNWHDGKALVHILDSLPRDELFQATEDELTDIGLSILEVQSRQRLAMFMRKDQFDRFYSCLVYIPRDRFDYVLCEKIRRMIIKALHSDVTMVKAQFGSFSLALVHYRVVLSPQSDKNFDSHQLESSLIEAARSWIDSLKLILESNLTENESLRLFKKYKGAFSKSYEDAFDAREAFEDIHFFEKALGHKTREIYVYRPTSYAETKLKIKIYNPVEALPLSDILPTIENLDLKVLKDIPYEIQPEGESHPLWVHDFEVESRGNYPIDLTLAKSNLSETFYGIWSGHAEDGPFNRLVIRAGFQWRQSTLFLAICRYLRQIEVPFSEQYMVSTLIQYPTLVKDIAALFQARFHPISHSKVEEHRLSKIIEEALRSLDNPDDDRIFRGFFNIVSAMIRTNFYQSQKDGAPKPYLSFKLDCSKIEDLPLPKPLYEIFVFSPEMEAIHLRGGKVARGGIRWSDRMEDYRKEILGLMKAQMVKNAVIVPVGSKGGFVVRKPKMRASREDIQEQTVSCYKTMIRGLLDLTDNWVQGTIVPPQDVVRHDDDDPYLVVAADKGTATFSDHANGLSESYNFWLQDAFASGGSQGYDHKKMGITARGAWESVRQHFRSLDINVDKESVTAVGIGDMSGDVFGNGLLLSEPLKLVAAFNHQHIFIDPSPIPEVGFKERQRLFNLPKSTWMDYNPELLSPGGRIFNRQTKTLGLTRQIMELLALDHAEISPPRLIQALLKMKVDLLWFGGIGTYVKSKFESHADVGDRVNDTVRVNGTDLRAKVIGEGANLGMTQLGRIEFARQGGLLNTDAIDNSAGVDCSDHEVNIKILMNQLVTNHQMTLIQRNQMLEEMTSNVATLVLRDNQLQNMAITNTLARGLGGLDQKARLMKTLEKSGLLNRELEYLPDDATLAEYQKNNRSFTRPEIAVLLGYSKIKAYQDILSSPLLDHPYFEGRLTTYFPTLLQQRYGQAIGQHPLRREIIATLAINVVINRMGPSFIHEMMEKTASSIESVLCAYFIVQEIFGLRDLWFRTENLHEHIGAKNQLSVALSLWHLVRRAVVWMLRSNPDKLDLTSTVSIFSKGIQDLEPHLQHCLDPESLSHLQKGIKGYVDLGLNIEFSERLAQLGLMASFPDIILIARDAQYPVQEAAKVYFLMGSHFGFNMLRRAAEDLKSNNLWHRLALMSLIEDLYNHQGELAISLLNYGKQHCMDIAGEADSLLNHWIRDHKQACMRIEQTLQEIKGSGSIGLAHLTLMTRELRLLTTQK